MKPFVFVRPPRDRLLTVLSARTGRWISIPDLMFDAGFLTSRRDRLTAFTSLYYWLDNISDAGAKGGYSIEFDRDSVRLVETTRVPA